VVFYDTDALPDSTSVRWTRMHKTCFGLPKQNNVGLTITLDQRFLANVSTEDIVLILLHEMIHVITWGPRLTVAQMAGFDPNDDDSVHPVEFMTKMDETNRLFNIMIKVYQEHLSANIPVYEPPSKRMKTNQPADAAESSGGPRVKRLVYELNQLVLYGFLMVKYDDAYYEITPVYIPLFSPIL